MRVPLHLFLFLSSSPTSIVCAAPANPSSSGILASGTRQFGVAPHRLTVWLNRAAGDSTAQITILNPSDQDAEISVWNNDTFLNSRAQSCRNGNCKLPHLLDLHALRAGPITAANNLFRASSDPVPFELRNIVVRLSNNSAFLKNGGFRLVSPISAECPVAGVEGGPSWTRRVFCPPTLGGSTGGVFTCEPEVFMNDLDREVQVKVPEHCTVSELDAYLRGMHLAYGVDEIIPDERGVIDDWVEPLENQSASEGAANRASKQRQGSASFNGEYPPERLYNSNAVDKVGAMLLVDLQGAYKFLADRGYDYSHTNPAVMVIDIGPRYDHPDLIDAVAVNEAELHGEPGIDDDGDGVIDNIYALDGTNMAKGDYKVTASMDFHGTAVMSVIAARPSNDIGVAGFGPLLRVIPCSVGTQTISVLATVRCMEWAIQNAKRFNLRIINHSYISSMSTVGVELDVMKRTADVGLVHSTATGNQWLHAEKDGAYTPYLYLPQNGLYHLFPAACVDGKATPQPSGWSKEWVPYWVPGKLPVLLSDDTSVVLGGGTSFAAALLTALMGNALLVNPKLTQWDLWWIIENSIHLVPTLDTYADWRGVPNATKILYAAEGSWLTGAAEWVTVPANGSVTLNLTVSARNPLLSGNEIETHRSSFLAVYVRSEDALNGAEFVGEVPVTVYIK